MNKGPDRSNPGFIGPAPLILFVLSLAVRLLHIALISGTPLTRILLIDSETYDRLARLILSGGFHGEEVYAMNVLYPYFLAAIYGLSGGTTAVFVVQAILDSLSVVMIHRLAGRWFGARAAWFAGAGAALYGPFIFYSATLLTPALILFLMLATLTALEAWRQEPRARLAVTSGLTLGLAALARGNNALFALLVAPFLKAPAGSRKTAVRHGLLFAAGVLLPLVAVTARNTLVEGEIVPVAANYAAFYIGHNDGATGLYAMPSFTESAAFDQEVWGTRDAVSKRLGRPVTLAESSRYLLDEGLRFAARHPARELELLARKFYFFWNRTESPTNVNYYFAREFSPVLRWLPPDFGWIGPLGLLGLVLTWPERRRLLLPYLFGLVPLITCLLFFVSAEYRITAAPVLLAFSGAAIVRVLEALRRPPRRRVLVTAGLLLPALALFTNIRTPLLRAQSLLRVDYLNYGTLFKMKGDFETAAPLLRKSLAIDPKFGPAYAVLAEVEGRRGNVAEATRLAAESRRYAAAGQYARGEPPRPASGDSLLAAAALYRGGDFVGARAGFEALLRTAPDDNAEYRASLRNNIGLCLYKLGQLADAERLYRDLIAGNPAYVKAYTNLGLVLEALGREEEARGLYRKALTLDPGNVSARRRLERRADPDSTPP